MSIKTSILYTCLYIRSYLSVNLLSKSIVIIHQVVQGIKKLKKLILHDQSIQVFKFHPEVPEGKSEYDVKTSHDEFDRWSLRSLLADYMHADPAARYQIAKNMFERTLSDLRVRLYTLRINYD